MTSDPDRDKAPNTSSSPPKSENPFIRFRQFADEQISSLLQSAIGLPSQFERGQNARWASFDEDLRRRDELQARQQRLRDSEARRAFGLLSAEDAERVDETFQKGLEDPVCSRKDNTLPQFDEQAAKDLPLFSPVYKSLFNHLEKRGDNAPDWDAANSATSLKKGFIPAYWPQPLLREQQSPDFMRNMAYFVYNDLNGEPFMRSEYSLLPYVLFSPYSPLKLAAERSPFSPHTPKDSKPDVFPYCEAFEDLIHETVHGRAAPPSGFGAQFSPYYPLSFQISPSLGMEWIQGLHRNGILQQKEHRSVHDMVYWPDPSSPPRIENARKRVGITGISVDTEQDMYEFFSSAPARQINTLASIFNDIESIFSKQLKKLESPEGKQALRELMDSKMAKDLFAMLDEKIAGAPPYQPKSKRRPTTAADAELAEVMSSEEMQQKRKRLTSSQDTEKVVSTSTTSERHVDEDGSVETTVTVWKRFADGRESTTTTTHFEDSGARNDSGEEREDVKTEKKADQSRKGWFWN